MNGDQQAPFADFYNTVGCTLHVIYPTTKPLSDTVNARMLCRGLKERIVKQSIIVVFY